MKVSAHLSKGYTLIEILVVLVILGILAAAVLVAINPAKRIAQSRDAKRRNDLAQIATSLVADDTFTGHYPVENTIDTSVGSSTWCKRSQLDSGSCAGLPQPGWDTNSAIYIALVTNGELKQMPIDPINSPPLYYWYEPRPAPCPGDYWDFLTQNEVLNACYTGCSTSPCDAKNKNCNDSDIYCDEYEIFTKLEFTGKTYGCGDALRFRAQGKTCLEW